MMNNDEKIIVKQPKVSAFTSFFFQDVKKGFFLPLKFVGSPLVWSCLHLQ